jgi:hypothetical protein
LCLENPDFPTATGTLTSHSASDLNVSSTKSLLRHHLMSVNMEVVAPTFHSLNKPQKRALVLRDLLRYTAPRHLDTFIEGIADDEPPAYKLINGTVYPPLVLVTLKESTMRFDLGNVQFSSDSEVGSGVYRAYLTVEDGSFELRTEEALPADEANLASVPIHIFIAKTMVPMFEAKFKAIWTRMNQINEIRQVAFNMTNKPVEEFHEGEVCWSRMQCDLVFVKLGNRHLGALDMSKLKRCGGTSLSLTRL